MTKRQSEALAFIRGFIERNGFSPSYREIAQGIGCTSNGNVHRLISALADQGCIQVLPGRARTITVRRPAA